MAVYRLVATVDSVAAERSGAPYTPGVITLAGMSPDGSLLAWVAEERPVTTVYVSDFEGQNIVSSTFPADAGGIWELEVTNSGILVRTSLGQVWHADTNANISPWFLGSENIPFVQEIEPAADGRSVFLIPRDGPNRWDLYVLHGQGEPMRVADDADIPCPPIQGCQGVWSLSNLAVSNDGSMMAVIVTGFHVLEADGLVHDVDHDEALSFSGAGWRYLTYDLPLGPVLGYLSLSPDGGTAMMHAAVQETPSISTRRWVSLDTQAGPLRELAAQDFNLSAAALSGDGTLAFIDLSQLITTDGAVVRDLFPNWNAHAIALAANADLSMSPDGRRIAFRNAAQDFHTGIVNDPRALSVAPVGIADVSLSEGVLEVTTSGPVRAVTLDGLLNGRLIPIGVPGPWRCSGPPHDDGQDPDAVQSDGVFTTYCERVTDEPMTFRIGATSDGQGWVIVMDVPDAELE